MGKGRPKGSANTGPSKAELRTRVIDLENKVASLTAENADLVAKLNRQASVLDLVETVPANASGLSEDNVVLPTAL